MHTPWAESDSYKNFGAQYHSGRLASPYLSSSLPFCVRFNVPVTSYAATLDTGPLAKSYPGGFTPTCLQLISSTHVQRIVLRFCTEPQTLPTDFAELKFILVAVEHDPVRVLADNQRIIATWAEQSRQLCRKKSTSVSSTASRAKTTRIELPTHRVWSHESMVSSSASACSMDATFSGCRPYRSVAAKAIQFQKCVGQPSRPSIGSHSRNVQAAHAESSSENSLGHCTGLSQND